MTLICAIKCTDGVVLGSEGQAGVNTSGGTIRHQLNKIHRLGGNTLFMASGTIGLIQKSLDVMKKYSNELDNGITEDTIMIMKKDLFPIFKSAKDYYLQYSGKADGTPTVNIIVCGFDLFGKPRIWHISPDMHDEFIDVVQVYCSGSGETAGYTLAKSFIKKEITCSQGRLIMYRIIKDSIHAIANGIGEPIDIWEIKDTKEIHRDTTLDMEDLSNKYDLWKKTEEKFIFL